MLALIRKAEPGTRSMAFNLGAHTVPEVRKAMQAFQPPAEAATVPSSLVKLSLDVGVHEHLLNSDLKLSMDLLSLLTNKSTVEVSGQLARPGLSIGQKRLEGAVAGASLSAVLLAFKTTRDVISNPVLGALGMIALGATVWPSISKLTLTLKPDGSVSTRIDFKMA